MARCEAVRDSAGADEPMEGEEPQGGRGEAGGEKPATGAVAEASAASAESMAVDEGEEKGKEVREEGSKEGGNDPGTEVAAGGAAVADATAAGSSGTADVSATPAAPASSSEGKAAADEEEGELKGVSAAARVVKESFPFTDFFRDAPNFRMTGRSYAVDMRMAESCFRHLQGVFQELEECRAFEIFKTTADRSNYLMARQAKVRETLNGGMREERTSEGEDF